MTTSADLFYKGALYLALNTAVRKQVTVAEYRCSTRGCYMGAVVSLNKGLYVLRKLRVRGFRYGILNRGLQVPNSAETELLSAEEAKRLPLAEFLEIAPKVNLEYFHSSFIEAVGAGSIWELTPSNLNVQLRCDHAHAFLNIDRDGLPRSRKNIVS